MKNSTRTNYCNFVSFLAFFLVIFVMAWNGGEVVHQLQTSSSIARPSPKSTAIVNDSEHVGKPASSKPIAVVHVGPHKTGSTSIQTFLGSKRGSMELDNYRVYPKTRKIKGTAILAHCFIENKSELGPWSGCTEEGSRRGAKKRDDVLGEFESFVQSALDESHNIILSAEAFDYPSFNITAFESYLVPSFQVKIVMSYRRFYDFFISYYNQKLKNGYIRDKNNLFLSFGDWVLSDDKVFEKYQSEHTYGLYKRFKKYDGDLSISVLNMHNSLNELSLVSDFFCNHVSNATNTCEVAKNSRDVKENPSKSSFLDRIFMDDLTRYYSGTSDIDILQQKDKSAKIRERFLNMTSFPLRCPSAALKERLLSVSIEAEKALTGKSWYESDDGIKSLKEDFEKKMSTTKSCVADVEQIVNTAEWQEFLVSITSVGKE